MSDEQKLREAVALIKAHLRAEWISEACETNAAFGCTSCQAVRLINDLDALSAWFDDEDRQP